MPHMDWCGKPCAECANPCALDESIPCSPDCENLFPDGTRNITDCFHAGCDAVEYRECGFSGAAHKATKIEREVINEQPNIFI